MYVYKIYNLIANKLLSFHNPASSFVYIVGIGTILVSTKQQVQVLVSAI